jgi:leucyl aminopeptidase (aminopeptidase T)
LAFQQECESVVMFTNAKFDEEVALRHLFVYLNTRPGKKILFAYEPAYELIAQRTALVSEQFETQVELVPVYEISAEELFERLTGAEKFVCAFNRNFETGFTKHVDVMIERSTSLSLKSFTLSDISRDFFNVFQAVPEKIFELNKNLMLLCGQAEELVVKDDRGTELSVKLDNRQFEWISIDGFSEADLDLTYNLPPGEIATYSPNVNGQIYFAGGLLGTIPIGRKYGFISEPIRFDITDGRISKIKTENESLLKDLEFCLNLTPFTSNVCEIGIGTNYAIRSLYGLNYTFEEKHYGFHLGFGATLAQQNNVERMTSHHLDLLFADCRLYLDGNLLYDGEFYTHE